jgi:muconate cycloisomerase
VKITGFQLYVIKLPTRRDHNWASKMDSPIGQHAIVRIDVDEGLSGWGEAPAGLTWGGADMHYYGESAGTVSHLVSDVLVPALIGLDPREISLIHRQMDRAVKGHPYAKAAIDIACWDIAGKAMNVPVHTLLGGQHRDGIELAHSLGIMSTEAAVDEAERAVAEGALTIKCKTGVDPERDVVLVKLLRERLGDSIKIRVDANEGYANVSQAVDVTRRQEEYGLMLCEQPLAGALALSRVAQRIESPVMADESAWTVKDVIELDRLEAAQYISCYVTKPGGLYRARQQGEVAERLGIGCDIGGSIETGIGNAANLHLGVALANATLPSVCPVSRPAGTDGPDIAGIYYTDDLIQNSFGFHEGKVMVPEGPGLGIEVDLEKLKLYSV